MIKFNLPAETPVETIELVQQVMPVLEFMDGIPDEPFEFTTHEGTGVKVTCDNPSIPQDIIDDMYNRWVNQLQDQGYAHLLNAKDQAWYATHGGSTD